MKVKPVISLTLLLLFILSGSYIIRAQRSISGQIEWKNSKPDANGESFPRFEDARYDIEHPLIPKKCESFEIGQSAASFYNLELSGLSYVDASAAEARALKGIDLKEQPQLEKGFGQSRGGNVMSGCFYPYVLQNGKVRKVKAYTITAYERSGAEALAKRAKTNGTTVTTSVLNNGDWHKLSITSTGIHKITPALLADNGITSSAVGIQDIKLVGNGEGMLPELVGAPRPEDLQAVPFQVFDQNNDGLFNGNDYALFFARGPHTWSYNSNSDTYSHTINTYRSSNYYFISVNAGPGNAVSAMQAVTSPATVQVNTFDDYQFVEDEEVNLVGTGRLWFGDVFDFTLSYNYSFNFPDIIQNEPARLRVRAGGRASTENTFLTASINGSNQVLNIGFPPHGGGSSPYVELKDEVANFNPPGPGFNVRLNYQNSANPSGVAWLDFIEVQVVRNLSYSSGMLFFRDGSIVGPGEVAGYTIANATQDLLVWDVTDHNEIKAVPTTFSNGQMTFRANADKFREYVAFKGNSFSEPKYEEKVPNQNLHGMDAQEMIIVTHPKFLSAAERLAQFHRDHDNMTLEVVTTDQVYNEFSSGGQDIAAIRDFAKNNYEKAQVNGVEFEHLLLFGDASYDYKDRITGNNNYVPVWESNSSLNLEYSPITDDFYTFLDSAEGDNSFYLDIMDISVGRIPCATVADGEAYVDKVIHYCTSPNRFGDWRNRILMMADDVDVTNPDNRFVPSSEEFSKKISQVNPAFNIDKIYLDAYAQKSTTGGETYPEAHDDMYRKVQQGNLITNYIGHGGEIGLSSEKLIGLSDVNGWTNLDAMPVFMTITCEFTRLDDPKRVSAGEQLCLNPNGGAISLISTTRVVGADPAINLNRAVFNEIFERPDNQPKTLGKVVKDAKNNQSGGSTRLKFSLFGDPAVRLPIPYYRVQTNTLNGQPFGQGVQDTIKALSKVEVTGQINDFSDQKITNFDGIVNVSVFDKPSKKETLVNDGNGPVREFDLQNNLLYKGKVQVVKGDFTFEFLVPKDISYQYGDGKISLYATNNITDAAGYNDSILVGGVNKNAEEDNTGPTVQLYMNDESFVRGGITDENPDLYAVIADSSGINTVGNSIGHDLLAILDNKTEQSYNINEYYEADLNSYQSGKVRYPFFDLAEGEHTLKLKVFDVHNNFTEAQTEFIVAESAEMVLDNVLNYPNPFTTHTDFQFEHNRSNEPLEVQVQIFTVSGKLVKTINRLIVAEGNRVQQKVTWNGLDDYGDKIGKGVYVYRVKVRSQLDNSTADKYEKLVILR